MKKAQLKRSRSAGPFHMDAPLSNLGLDREVIAPASSRTDLAHPSIIRKVGRRSFIISIAILLAARPTNPWPRRTFRLLTQSWDSELRGLRLFHQFRGSGTWT
jgi:hypothetical protein